MAEVAAIHLSPAVSSPPRTQINWDPPLFLNLLAPAVLLGFLRMWATWLAPSHGVYFTSEMILLAYAYFALARAVFLRTHSYDSQGYYHKALAHKAEQDFYRELRSRQAWLAVRGAPLLLLAITADVVTAGSLVQARVWTLVLVIGAELLLWGRLGAAFIVASGRWSSVRPFDLTEARRLVKENAIRVRRTFWIPNIAFWVVAYAAMRVYKPIGAFVISVVPNTDTAAFLYAVSFHAALAWWALWLQCRWAGWIVPTLKGPVSLEEIANGGRNLRSNPRLRRLLSTPAKSD